jgi:hypothetical protein
VTQRQHCRHACLLSSKTAQPHKDGLLPHCAGLPARKWRKWARRWMACHAVAIAQRDARVRLPQSWGTDLESETLQGPAQPTPRQRPQR